jgi:hypothetical protein
MENETFDDLVVRILGLCDAFEFAATKSKAKNTKQLELRAMKKLRDALMEAGLESWKVD